MKTKTTTKQATGRKLTAPEAHAAIDAFRSSRNQQAARLPKARVAWLHETIMPYQLSDEMTQEGEYPVAVIPCHDPKQARALIRVAGFFAMGEERQAQQIAEAISDFYNAPAHKFLKDAKAVLTLIASGGARK